mmetsp:Transcript_25414/g.69026  ORF Transcript_25414/g.69026 Transcript_25414/m.69026 type:complete len:209 (-) Transcript_25414:2397-3023(-)
MSLDLARTPLLPPFKHGVSLLLLLLLLHAICCGSSRARTTCSASRAFHSSWGRPDFLLHQYRGLRSYAPGLPKPMWSQTVSYNQRLLQLRPPGAHNKICCAHQGRDAKSQSQREAQDHAQIAIAAAAVGVLIISRWPIRDHIIPIIGRSGLARVLTRGSTLIWRLHYLPLTLRITDELVPQPTRQCGIQGTAVRGCAVSLRKPPPRRI